MNLRSGQAAAALGISRTTLYRWTREGIIPDQAIVPGRVQVRYNMEALRAANFEVKVETVPRG